VEINANGKRFLAPCVFCGVTLETRLIALHRLATFCLVTSLHDGMNRREEFVASRIDRDGVLILSQFSGAASRLSDAILVNPFAEERLRRPSATPCVGP
jgi:trehalose-6-phosphate synthase